MNVRAIVFTLALCSLVSTGIGGFLYYHSAKESAVKEAEGELEAKTNLLKDAVVRVISAQSTETRTLGLFEELQEALLRTNPDTVSIVNRILDHFAEGRGLSVSYVLDATGKAIASSNRNQPDSFVGHNYSFRPYFVEAINGAASTYLALGVTSELRGIYSSHPVYLAGGVKPVGVAVIKRSVEDLDKEISTLNGGIGLLVHSSGVIFACSRKDWILNLLWSVSPEELSRINETRQFGKGPWKWTGLERRSSDEAADGSGERYLMRELELQDVLEWRVVYLQGRTAMFRKIVDPLVGWTGYAASILFVFVVGMMVLLYRLAQRDLYRRKQAEDALRMSEVNYHSIFSSVNDAIFVHDFQTGTILDVNPKMCDMYGYTEREATCLTVDDLSLGKPPYTQEEAQQWIKRAVEQGPQLFEWMAKDKAGRLFWVEVNLKVAVIAGERRVLAVVRDISDRKRTEEALRERENRYRHLIDGAIDFVYRTDRKGFFTFANPVALKVFGYSEQEFIGRHYLDLIAPEHRGNSQRFYENQLVKRIPNTYHEFPLLTKDGRTLWIGQNVQLLMEGEEVTGFQAIARDLTKTKHVEELLRTSEERLRLAWQTIPDALSVSKLSDGTFVEINSGYTVLTGYTRDEIVGRSSLDIPTWGDPSDRDAFAATIMREGRIRNFETVARRKDGELRTIEISAGLMTVEGEPHLLAISRDIEDLKRAQTRLQESEATLGTLLQAAPIGIGQVSADRTLGWTNQLLCSMLGYSSEELFGKSARMVYESEEEFLRVGREKHPDVIKHGTGSVETRFRRKDGTVFDVLLSSSSILTGDLSQGMVFTAMDITERKRVEQHLKRLVAAVESAQEAIMVTDREGAIVYVNPMFEDITGYSQQEVLGENPRILKSGKHGRGFYEEMWSALLAGEVWRGRLINRRKDGTLYQETATISSVRDESGQIVNYVAVKRDITEEVMLQQQLLHAQKMEAIGTLAGGVAHDFNNLLQAILGYSDLLLMKKGWEELDRKKLEVIQHAARDGADLVARILTFSRKVGPKVRPLDLNQEILKAEPLLRRTLPRMIEIRLMLAEAVQVIDADPAQLEQVLLNLATNAQHAMPDGGQLIIETSNVSLSDEYLRTHLKAKRGKYVLLTVSDTGVGMEPEILGRIFEPFFTTKANGEGTGLGLSMVHGIVSQHGGYIRCYSEAGIGTSFKIYFPVSASDLISDLTWTREMPAFGTETILLVDDDDSVREVARQMIEVGGYKVLTARSGEEALEVYNSRREEISLIILDLIMPGMGGKRCLELLLEIDPDVRVLVATGYSSNGVLIERETGGARGVISKPYDAKDILAAIRKVLDKGHL